MRTLILIISIIGTIVATPFGMAKKVVTTIFTYVCNDVILEIAGMTNIYKQQMEAVKLAKKTAKALYTEEKKEDNLIEMKRDDLFQEEKKDETNK